MAQITRAQLFEFAKQEPDLYRQLFPNDPINFSYFEPEPVAEPESSSNFGVLDAAKLATAGVYDGLGGAFQGAARTFITEPINAASRVLTGYDPMLRAVNPLESFSTNLRESVSDEGKVAMEGSTPTGSILDPSSWSFGEDPSARGYVNQLAGVFGQLAPQIAGGAALNLYKAPAAAQAAFGFGTGAAQSAGLEGAARGDVVREMDEVTLFNESPEYRELLRQIDDPEKARERLALNTEYMAGVGAAVPAGVEGLVLQGLLGGRIRTPNFLGNSAAGRTASGALAGGAFEATQEIAEGVGGTLGSNFATGFRDDPFEDSFASAVLGFAPGATIGGAAGFFGNDALNQQLRPGEDALSGELDTLMGEPAAAPDLASNAAPMAADAPTMAPSTTPESQAADLAQRDQQVSAIQAQLADPNLVPGRRTMLQNRLNRLESATTEELRAELARLDQGTPNVQAPEVQVQQTLQGQAEDLEVPKLAGERAGMAGLASPAPASVEMAQPEQAAALTPPGATVTESTLPPLGAPNDAADQQQPAGLSVSQFIPAPAPAGDVGQVGQAGAKPDEGRDLVGAMRRFLGATGRPELREAITDDAFTAVETPEPYRPLADAIQRVFGQRVVFFDSTVDAQAAFGFDGVVIDEAGGRVFVSAATERPTRKVVFHELFHGLARSDRELYGQLVNKLDVGQWQSAKYQKDAGITGRSKSYTTEEMLADTFAENADNPQFWANLGEQMPQSAVQKLVSSITQILTKLKSAFDSSPDNRQMGEYIADLESVRGALNQFTKDYVARNPQGTKDLFTGENAGDMAFARSAPPESFRPAPVEATQFRETLSKTMSTPRSVVPPIRVGRTPPVFQALGASDVPIEISRDVVRKATNGVKHSVPMTAIEALPEELADPVAIFSSSTQADSLVSLTEVNDANGDPVIVALRLDRRGQSYRVNQIASVYGKERAQKWLADQIGSRRMLYRSERAPASPALKGLQLPNSVSGSRGTAQTILTEADVVKQTGQPPAQPMFSRRDTDFTNPEDRRKISTTQPSRKQTAAEKKAGTPAPDSYTEKWVIDRKDVEATDKHINAIDKALRSYDTLSGKGTPKALRDELVAVVKDNLLWLHDLVPAQIRERAKKWYDGANRIAGDWATKYGIDDRQSAAVLAALSPQMDWFKNVSLAERLIEIHQKHGDSRWTPAMTAWAESWLNASETIETKESREAHVEKMRRLEGKTLSELSGEDAAYFIRVFDETYFERRYRMVSPEGAFLGYVGKGEAEPMDADEAAAAGIDLDAAEGDFASVTWGGFGTIAKGVAVLRATPGENLVRVIDREMGGEHKVRNFYNNIIEPASADGDVTIDTHAVGAGLLKVVSGSTTEVMNNLGSGAGGNNDTGASGSYGLFADAYREAAAERGLLAREMQSITWEAVRALFPAAEKRALRPKVDAINAQIKGNQISRDEGRQRISEIGKPVDRVAWEGLESDQFPAAGGTSLNLELDPDPSMRPARTLAPQDAKDKIALGVSVAQNTDDTNLTGLRALTEAAESGDQEAARLLQDIAVESLKALLSGTSARVKATPTAGYFEGSFDPSAAVAVTFTDSDREAVLAGLARFADNFNQTEIHARKGLPKNAKPGTEFGDGSFATPVYRWTLDKALSRKQIERIINDSGLVGLTVGDGFVETYFSGDPTNEQAATEFVDAVKRAEKLLGRGARPADAAVARLWPYGRDGRLGYDRIRGDLPPSAGFSPKIAERIAGYLSLTPAERKTPGKKPPLIKGQAALSEITPEYRAREELRARQFSALPVNDLKRGVVRKAYAAAGKAVVEQYKAMPVKVEVWADGTEPYASSDAMRKDVQENNHLFILATDTQNFGPPGADFSAHPLLKDSGLKDVNGAPLLLNDVLRAVHDYYAHNMSASQFGPKGEDAAWRNHMASTADPWARWAIMSETKAQNAWQNFRPGAEAVPKLIDRGFAAQKAALMPLESVLTGNAKIDAPVRALMNELQEKRPDDLRGSLPKNWDGQFVPDPADPISNAALAEQTPPDGGVTRSGPAFSKKVTDLGEVRREREDTQKLKSFHSDLGKSIAARVEKTRAEIAATNFQYAPGDEVLGGKGQRLEILGRVLARDMRPPLPPMTEMKARKAVVDARPKVPGYRVRETGMDGPDSWAEYDLPEYGIKGRVGGLRSVKRDAANDEGPAFARRASADPYAQENARLREEHKTLYGRAKKLYQEYIGPAGLLPVGVFDMNRSRVREIAGDDFDTRVRVGALEAAVKKDYGVAFDQMQPATIEKLNEALVGRFPVTQLRPNTARELMAMRQSIDAYSQAYIERLEQVPGNEELITKIEGNLGAYLNRSYRAFDDPKWFKSVPTSVVNTAREYLRDQYLADGDPPAEAARRAEVTLNKLLKTGTAYESMESFIKESKVGSKDLSVLIKRKNIAPEIRALLGEHTDPRVNFGKSAMKMSRLVANTDFLNHVRQMGVGTFLFEEDTRPPDATVQLAGDGSKVYEPLNGLWTTPEIAEAFDEAMDRKKVEGVWAAIVRTNGMIKYGKTVLSPTTAMRNWQSAMFFSVANGHFNILKARDGFKLARAQYLRGREGGEGAGTDAQRAKAADTNAYIRKLVKLGVVGDGAQVNEVMRLIDDSKIEAIFERFGEKGFKAVRTLNDIAQTFYQFGDDFWKIIGFEHEKAGWEKAGLTGAEAEKKAAERVVATYPTYSMQGKLVKGLSRLPFIASFPTFTAEMIRTSVNLVKLTFEDLRSSNPAIRAMGAKRAVGLSMVGGMFIAVSALTRAMFGVDDEEEEAIRDLAPPWQTNSTFAYAGRDEKGRLRYFDLTFLDPYGYFKRPWEAFARDQPWEEKLASSVGELFAPFLSQDIAFGVVMEMVANRKDSGAPIWGETDTAVEQAQKGLTHMVSKLQPGITNNIQRTLTAMQGKTLASGRQLNPQDEMMAWLGWRASTMDPKSSIYYRSFDFADQMSEARSAVTKPLRNLNDLDESDIQSAVRDGRRRHAEAFREMARVVTAARKAGMTDAEIRETLSGSGVSTTNIAALLEGRVPPMRLSLQAQANAVKSATGRGDAEFARTVRDRFMAARKELAAQESQR